MPDLLAADAFAPGWWAFVRSVKPGSRLRLAPTPSGFLHVGNAVNFTLNWLAARLTPGVRLLLRIDDLDSERKRPEYVQNIFEVLCWLGLDWDEGPRTAADLEGRWSQRHRMPLYEALLTALRTGQWLFACAKSRRELAPFGGDYPEAFRQQACNLDDARVAWRLHTPLPHRPEWMPPDFVVRRRDGIPAYQVASVADDVHFSVTHIIRGEDLMPSTRAQQYLAQCAGQPWASFCSLHFLHHPLLTDDQGQKLSKSAGALALSEQRQRGLAPALVFRVVAQWLGLRASAAESAHTLLAEAGARMAR